MTYYEVIPVEINTPEWLELRRQGIGGSDCAGIMGMSKYEDSTPYQIWLEKTGQGEPKKIEEWHKRGHILESAVLKWYNQQNTLLTAEPVSAIFRSTKYPWMQFTPDAVLPCHSRNVQVKTSRLSDEWGDPETDQVPKDILIQCQHEMIILGAPVTDIPVLTFGLEFQKYVVKADKEIQEAIIEEERRFWHEHVLRKVEPLITTSEDIKKRYPFSNGKATTATTEDFQNYIELKRVREESDAIEVKKHQLEILIKKSMGDFESIENSGKTLATWKTTKPGQKFDIDTFKQVYPEIYNKYLIETAPQRRFLIK
jgi:putative phage-type endonuclease